LTVLKVWGGTCWEVRSRRVKKEICPEKRGESERLRERTVENNSIFPLFVFCHPGTGKYAIARKDY